MTTWYTEPEAAAYLKVPEEKLKVARYRKKVKATKLCGIVQYKGEWLDQFREGECEEHPSSANALGRRSIISRSPKGDDQDELAQARAMVLRLSASSRTSSSNAGSHN